jgi:hypothetical protein
MSTKFRFYLALDVGVGYCLQQGFETWSNRETDLLLEPNWLVQQQFERYLARISAEDRLFWSLSHILTASRQMSENNAHDLFFRSLPIYHHSYPAEFHSTLTYLSR